MALMRLTFIELSAFTARWRKEKLTDEKLQEIQSAILDNPGAGDSMPPPEDCARSGWLPRREPERAKALATA